MRHHSIAYAIKHSLLVALGVNYKTLQSDDAEKHQFGHGGCSEIDQLPIPASTSVLRALRWSRLPIYA
jgi:hypothetical protein